MHGAETGTDTNKVKIQLMGQLWSRKVTEKRIMNVLIEDILEF